MAFRFAKPADFSFEAGHSVTVSLIDPPETDRKGNSRSFSLASAPYETELMIATRMRDTAFKRSLKAMPAGGRIHLRGPAGKFTLDGADARPASLPRGGHRHHAVREHVAAGGTTNGSPANSGCSTPTAGPRMRLFLTSSPAASRQPRTALSAP